MFDLIFWLIVVLYWGVGIKRIPLYYKRVDEYNAKEYPHMSANGGMAKMTAVAAIFMAVFWPYYEAGRWVLNYVIQTATAEQRKWDEYVKAEKIVEEYKARKEREDREAFDRALKGEG